MFVDQSSEGIYVPLNHMTPDQEAKFEVRFFPVRTHIVSHLYYLEANVAACAVGSQLSVVGGSCARLRVWRQCGKSTQACHMGSAVW